MIYIHNKINSYQKNWNFLILKFFKKISELFTPSAPYLFRIRIKKPKFLVLKAEIYKINLCILINIQLFDYHLPIKNSKQYIYINKF